PGRPKCGATFSCPTARRCAPSWPRCARCSIRPSALLPKATAPRSRRCWRAPPRRAATGARSKPFMTGQPYLDLPRARQARGQVALPGSKSISNRVLLLAALAAGRTDISGLLDSDDTRVMLAALRQLGVELADAGGGRVTVAGAGRFPVKQADLFLGNAGTAFRPLTAALALMGGQYRLSGVPRMHERPIGDLVDALRQWGARIDYLGQAGYPPLAVGEGRIRADAP